MYKLRTRSRAAQKLILGASAGLVTFGVGACLCAAGQTPSPPGMLPVRQITLFSSGVAYTERGGSVEGSATVPLIFRTAQINDILKSMVLIDRGGKVQPATYAARDPIGRTLQGFAIDVSDDLSQAQLLGKLRGARVSIESVNEGPGKPNLDGQIVGVDERQVGGDTKQPITASYITILTDKGLTAVRLDSDRVVRILDERLNRELHEALTTLATGSDTQRRQVTLHFAGAGRRDVRVAYVMEAPIWKISYRMLLGAEAKPGSAAPAVKPYLQGWAIVENTTDEDWRNVKLTLVSGRPVSFIQDLYQPLYIPRPQVGPDIVASPYPQTHDENLEASRPAAQPGIGGNQEQRSGRGAGGAAAKSALRPELAPGDQTALSNNNVYINLGRDDADGQRAFRGLQARATGGRAGEMFKYSITTPINLQRQQAAMIPVIAQEIGADRLSIYNADLDGRFAMNALRIRNNTTVHLKGGPITLFDGGTYAGDAKMEDVPPGDTRLISYAVDLAMLCDRRTPVVNTINTTIHVKRGLFTESRSERTETLYTLKSKANRPRTVLVTHPYLAGYSLVAPEKAAERTATEYRFAVVVPPGESRTLKVVTGRTLSTTVALADMTTDHVALYVRGASLSSRLKLQLEEVVRRRKQISELKAQSAVIDAEIGSINDDQDRIRKNMAALDKSSTLYKRYVSELDLEETRIQMARQESTHVQHQITNADEALHAYMDKLDD